MHKVAIAADLGGTNLRLGLVSIDGRIVRRQSISLPGASDPIELLKSGAKSFSAFGKGKGWKILGFGAAVPGVIDISRGVVTESPNYPGWRNLPLYSILSRDFPVPIVLENDANAYAYGEGWKGAGRKFRTYVVLTLGTGVGGGLVLDGKIWRGSHGMAGEIGHVCVDPNGPPCNCGSRGCLEVFSSATGMTRMIREALAQKIKSSLRGYLDLGERRPDPLDVYMEAKKGDVLALRSFEIAGKFLGVALAGIINLLNPEAIILGGNVSRAYKFFAPAMKKEIILRAYDAPRKMTKILRATLGDNAGILGAARVCFDGIKKTRPPSSGKPGLLRI